MSPRLAFLVLPALLVPACGPAPGPPPPTAGAVEDPPAPAGARRLLALGDSYTIGQGVEPAERWPVQLVAALRGRGLELADPTVLAHTGWTTDELAAALGRSNLKGPYALVSLLIGTNDQFRGRDAEDYRGRFAPLLGRAVELAGGRADRVLVLSLPDWGVTPHARGRDRAAVAAAIDRFNVVNREETRRAGARYIEVTTASRRATDEPGLIAADGLHHSGKGYAEWAAAALPPALAALGP